MSPARHRVLLAEDHPAMRESVAAALEDFHRARVEVVGHAADGVEAVELAKKFRPDLVLLDIGMPRLDGLRALRLIKEENPKVLVLIFSMYDDQAHVVEAIRAGADDYLFKHEARPAEVARHILAALEKKAPEGDGLRARLFSALRESGEGRPDLGLARLTGAELEVLKLAGHRGLTMKEIGRDLGGLSPSTVRKHFEHIYAKLGAQSQAHAVCLAVKAGLISSDPAEPSDG